MEAVGEPRNESERGGRAGPSDSSPIFGGGDNVAGLGDGIDLGNHNGGTSIEGIADGGVVVAGDTIEEEDVRRGGQVEGGCLKDKHTVQMGLICHRS